MSPMRPSGPEEVETLRRQLAEAQATIDALLAAEIETTAGSKPGGPPQLRQAQRALRALETRLAEAAATVAETAQKYRLLFDRNPHAMWVYDAASRRILAVNDTALARLGYSRDEVLQMEVRDLLDPSARSAFAERGASDEVATGSRGSWPVRCRDGTSLQADITTQALVFEGRPAQLALAVDVTDRVRTEQALRISERKFEAIFLASPLGIYIVEPVSQRIVEANPSFCAIVGVERAGLVGTTTVECGIWDDPGQRDALVAELLAGRPVRSIEARLRTPAGERRTVLVSLDLLALDQADEPLMGPWWRTSPSGGPSRSSSGRRRRWRRSACWPGAWRTISTTC